MTVDADEPSPDLPLVKPQVMVSLNQDVNLGDLDVGESALLLLGRVDPTHLGRFLVEFQGYFK